MTDTHPQALAQSLHKNQISRRQALWLVGASSAATAPTSGAPDSP